MDLDIINRLHQLKKTETALPTEEQVSARLAALKGLPSDYYTKPSNIALQGTVRKTQVEQTDDLLMQV